MVKNFCGFSINFWIFSFEYVKFWLYGFYFFIFFLCFGVCLVVVVWVGGFVWSWWLFGFLEFGCWFLVVFLNWYLFIVFVIVVV